MRTSFWTQATAITKRDLMRERRSGEVLWVTLPFGAIALLLIPIAIGTDRPMLRAIGIGMYWVIVMLFGVLIAVRQAHTESQAQRDVVALTGIDPAAGYVGRVIASFLFLIGFEAVLAIVTVALYDVPTDGWLWMPLVMVLVGLGLSLLGTLAASIVSTGRSASALVPLLVAPLSVPLLIGATQTFEAIRLGRSSLTWTLMMTIVILLLAIAGVLSARTLQES
ncbi:MAG: heme exporter protein CcmB [Actinomycetia bacterium]|nr:heme exporter protein CcmB [Actinomycetes bacterium]